MPPRSSLLCAALLLPMAIGLAGCNTWWHQAASDYPVFFSPGSAALSETAKAVIQVAADYARQHARQNVVVNGYTDLSGSAAANAALSADRAKAVTEQLVTDGVAREQVRYNANGPSDALLSGQADRRVDITIGG